MLFRQRPFMEAFKHLMHPNATMELDSHIYYYPLKVSVEQLLHDKTPPGYDHQIPRFLSIIA